MTFNGSKARFYLRVFSIALLHGTAILRPHPTDEAMIRCLACGHNTQRSGWTRTQRRGASSFKGRRINHSATEVPLSMDLAFPEEETQPIPAPLFNRIIC